MMMYNLYIYIYILSSMFVQLHVVLMSLIFRMIRCETRLELVSIINFCCPYNRIENANNAAM